jgi:hypothetical protein
MKNLAWGYQLSCRSMINPRIQRMGPYTQPMKKKKGKKKNKKKSLQQLG